MLYHCHGRANTVSRQCLLLYHVKCRATIDKFFTMSCVVILYVSAIWWLLLNSEVGRFYCKINFDQNVGSEVLLFKIYIATN